MPNLSLARRLLLTAVAATFAAAPASTPVIAAPEQGEVTPEACRQLGYEVSSPERDDFRRSGRLGGYSAMPAAPLAAQSSAPRRRADPGPRCPPDPAAVRAPACSHRLHRHGRNQRDA